MGEDISHTASRRLTVWPGGMLTSQRAHRRVFRPAFRTATKPEPKKEVVAIDIDLIPGKVGTEDAQDVRDHAPLLLLHPDRFPGSPLSRGLYGTIFRFMIPVLTPLLRKTVGS